MSGWQGQVGEDGDLLPGLVALAQSWLDDVAFGSFRRSSSKPADLDSWFANTQVTLYLKVTHRHSPFFSAALLDSCLHLPTLVHILAGPVFQGPMT